MPTSAEDTTLAPRPPVAFGITPTSLDAAWRFAQMLANSDLVPKEYRGKPENCMVAMQYGAEVGLPPMGALQSIAVINGKPGLYGDGFLAVITAQPSYLTHQEYYLVRGERRDHLTPDDLKLEDTCAVTAFWRVGHADPFTATFSVGDARKANLIGKEGPWTQYPARMLRWRARGWAGRDGFARELRGMGLAEELRDSARAEAEPARPLEAPVRRSALAASAPEPPAEDPDAHPVDPPPLEDAPPDVGPREAPPADATTPTAAGPRPRRSPPPPTPRTTPQLIIEETLVVAAKGQQPQGYEIHGRAGPIGHVFFTTDEALYKQALSCEGTGVLLSATWHMGQRADAPAKILDALGAAD